MSEAPKQTFTSDPPSNVDALAQIKFLVFMLIEHQERAQDENENAKRVAKIIEQKTSVRADHSHGDIDVIDLSIDQYFQEKAIETRKRVREVLQPSQSGWYVHPSS